MTNLTDATKEELINELVSRFGATVTNHSSKKDGSYLEFYMGDDNDPGLFTVIMIEDVE